jgi:NodT family efflux transporter outer membrane factor (OMF) lipoprotein
MNAGRLWISLVMLVGVAGCTIGPDYRKPDVATPAAWSAPLPHGGSTSQLIGWWDRFDHPALTRLLQMAEADSPSLAEAWANIRIARATLTTDRAGGLPSLTANGSAERTRQSQGTDAAMANVLSGDLDASWELDLFGKVRRTTEAAKARLDARAADWHDARVSLAAEVADDYVQYRACQLLVRAYADEAQSQQETARATETAVTAGLTSPADGVLANASAASALSTLTAQRAECDVLVKALVDLTGADEATVRALLAQQEPTLPQSARFAVDNVPASLIAQRPDLASLERELAAASAEIGAAEADRYPSLSLTGSITRSNNSLTGILTTWGIGPSVSLPIFDAGKRAAAVDSARASYDLQLAKYTQSLRTAVKEVEQALVRLDGATRRTGDAETAAKKYREYFDSIDRNWRAGGASLLDREEARRNALSADITFITVQRDQIQYWIALYKALGGGWNSDSSPSVSSKPLRDQP